MNEEIQRLVKRSDTLFNSTERVNAKKIWEEISVFILNNQSGIFNGETTGGQVKTNRVFDSTAIQSNHDLASSIHSTLTNPATKWSKIRFTSEALNNHPEAVAWLQAANKKIHDHLNESNFDTEISKNYKKFCSLGNMALLQDTEISDDGFDKFKFKALHLAELAFSENANGRIDTVFREFKMTARQIVEQFPSVNKEFIEKAEKDPDCEMTILHAIFPREKKKVKLNKEGLAIGKHRPFASLYILKEGSVNDENHILEESGYYEFPIHVVRWETIPGEVYGRGPGHIALPDVKSLNKVKELGLQAMAKAVNPPTMAEQKAIIGQLDLRPNKLTIVRNIDKVKEWRTEARFDITNFAVDDFRESIRHIFFLDKLALPPRTETGEMTALEVQRRTEEMQRVIGPTLGRLNAELLIPLITRTFKMLLRAEKLPPMPSILEQEGVDIDIVFVNQLARSQQIEEVTAIQSWVQDMLVIAQAKPEILDNLNVDAAAKHIGKVRGVPEHVISNDGEVKQVRQQRAEQQQQQQLMDMGTQMADINSKLGDEE